MPVGSGGFWRCAALALLISAAAADAAPQAPPNAPPGPTTRTIRRRANAQPPPAAPANPLPGVAAQQDTLKKIREIYAIDYTDASFNARRLLAQRLIGASADTRRDSDAKFVLLREARDVAAAAGDVPTAFEAIDRLADAFPVNKLVERIEVMKMAMPALSAPQAHLAGASICVDLADQCVAEGDYDHADLLLSLGSGAARAAKSVPYFKWIESRTKAMRPLREAYEIARPAEATLASAPGDPQANLVMGTFVAFVKGDIDNGLGLMARGSDSVLKTLADDDLDNPESTAEAFRMAGRWWEMAEQYPEYRGAMRNRAGFWYRRAVPGLDGLDKALAQRRLLEQNPPAKPGARMEHPPDALRLTATHWYRPSVAEVSWETAQRLCLEAGGQLVSVETRAEGEMMTKLARGRTVWLGASTDGTGHWDWLSGGEFFYAPWASGEPSIHTIDAHVVTTPNGSWKTSSGRAGFICEWAE